MKLAPNQDAPHGKLILLAPPQARIFPLSRPLSRPLSGPLSGPLSRLLPDGRCGEFARIQIDSRRHESLLHGAQRLRGRLYREDGAIRASEISRDGRLVHAADARGWHVLALDRNGEVCGCSRYLAHPNTVDFLQLGVHESAFAHSRDGGAILRTAVDLEIARARRRGIAFVEVGGWALDPSMRCTAEAIRIALATYSLARILGGCIGIAAATKRHCSAAILRRIGGRPLQINEFEVPSYYDPRFACEMELLRFDSDQPNPRFETCIEDLCAYLTSALVIQAEPEEAPAQLTPRANKACAHQAWGLGRDLVPAVQ